MVKTRKRCPNGSKRNKKTRVCVRKKCPNGSRKDASGKCHKKGRKRRRSSTAGHTFGRAIRFPKCKDPYRERTPKRPRKKTVKRTPTPGMTKRPTIAMTNFNGYSPSPGYTPGPSTYSPSPRYRHTQGTPSPINEVVSPVTIRQTAGPTIKLSEFKTPKCPEGFPAYCNMPDASRASKFKCVREKEHCVWNNSRFNLDQNNFVPYRKNPV